MEVEMRVEVYDSTTQTTAGLLSNVSVLSIDEICERPIDVLCTVNAGDFPELMDNVMGTVKETSTHLVTVDQVVELRCGLDSTNLESDDYDTLSQALEEAEGLLRENPETLVSITLE